MRILACNPDSIGDVVLRQPLYAALRQAGHQLTLIVRPSLVPIMPLIAPDADVLVLPIDPYAPTIDWRAVSRLIDCAKAFEPDLLLIPSYQWTAFEEHLAFSLPGVRRSGMTGRLYPGDPRTGVYHQSQMAIDFAVEVSEETLELRKNELLCSAVLGRQVQLPSPRIQANPDQLRTAQTLATRFGLEPAKYWIACVGHHDYTKVRNWGIANWGESLAYWSRTHGRRLLLIGSESESDASHEIAAIVEREAPGASQVAHGLSLDALVGVTELSAGYIGRDTGPMHIAAACGKPVIAVFGGGTWPRFLPAAIPSRVLTIKVPCVGCDWICHLENSYCVKSVPVADVCRAIDDMEAGRITTAEVEAAEPSPPLVARMMREAAVSVRQSLLRAIRAEGSTVQQESLEPRLTEVEQSLALATKLNHSLQTQLSTAEVQAVNLQVKSAEVRLERDVLAEALRQSEQRLIAEQQTARANRRRLERIAQSKWHRLGRAIGLKLETTPPQPNPLAGGQAPGVKPTQS